MKRYVTITEVIYIHEKLINEFGGKLGVLNRNSLEAALMRPQVG